MTSSRRMFARLAAVALAVALTTSACGGGTSSTEASSTPAGSAASSGAASTVAPAGERGTLRWGMYSSTGQLDLGPMQLVRAGDLFPAGFVFDTLFTLDASGTLEPNLAESYDLSSDALVLHLRDGVTFSDGEPFDAAAVKANLEFMKAKALPPIASKLAPVESVTVDDPTTVTLHLSEPAPALPYQLAREIGLMVAPKHLEEQNANPVGTGPYVFNAEKSRAGSMMVYDANPNYWAPDQVGFDQIEVHFYSNLTQAAQALRAGELDGSNLAPADAATFVGQDGFQVPQGTSVYFGMVFLDRDGKVVPAFGDQKVRCGISRAIDRDTLISVSEGGLGAPATQIWQDGPFHVDGIDDQVGTNLDTAKQDLAGVSPLTFTMPTNPLFKSRTEALSSVLSQAGVTAELKPVSDPFTDFYYTPEWGAVYAPIEVVHPADLIAKIIRPGGMFNPNNEASPKLEELYQKALSLSGDAADAAWRDALAEVYTQCDIAVAAGILEPVVTTDALDGVGIAYLVPGGATIRTMHFKK